MISEFELCGLHCIGILGDTTSIDGWLPPLILGYLHGSCLYDSVACTSLWDGLFLTFMFIFSVYTVQ